MSLISLVNELMPAGQCNYLTVVKYPPVAALIAQEGYKKMLAVMVILVKEFCSAFNVVRNMNEDQMIDAGAMLLEECGNFRLEDYVMMFQLAKKGNLVKIYDRIDLQTITAILDAYWLKRNEAGLKAQESEYQSLEDATGNNILGEWVNPAERGSKEGESMAQLTAKLEIAKQKNP